MKIKFVFTILLIIFISIVGFSQDNSGHCNIPPDQGPPGGDTPDDNFSFSSGNTIQYSINSKCLIYMNGYFKEANALVGGNYFKGSDSAEQLLKASSILIFPSGGLFGMENDKAMNLLADIPVILSTSAGELERGNSIRFTDKNGMVSEYLYTKETATVSAESGSKAVKIEVTVEENQLPSADFSISPSSVKINETVYFNGSLSSDADGRIVNWEWNFGDGNSGLGEKTTHAYAKAGTYSVTLKVIDNNGGSAVSQQTITISE